jgi:DNA-binding protein H-NS
MATRKSSSTLAALNAQIAALQAKADALRKKESAAVIEQVKLAIAHYGLTAADLGLANKLGRPAKPEGVAKPRVARKAAGTKKPSKVVKFRDADGNTWGGIGKRPRWFSAALAAGKKPEELLAK